MLSFVIIVNIVFAVVVFFNFILKAMYVCGGYDRGFAATADVIVAVTVLRALFRLSLVLYSQCKPVAPYRSSFLEMRCATDKNREENFLLTSFIPYLQGQDVLAVKIQVPLSRCNLTNPDTE